MSTPLWIIFDAKGDVIYSGMDHSEAVKFHTAHKKNFMARTILPYKDTEGEQFQLEMATWIGDNLDLKRLGIARYECLKHTKFLMIKEGIVDDEVDTAMTMRDVREGCIVEIEDRNFSIYPDILWMQGMVTRVGDKNGMARIVTSVNGAEKVVWEHTCNLKKVYD